MPLLVRVAGGVSGRLRRPESLEDTLEADVMSAHHHT